MPAASALTHIGGATAMPVISKQWQFKSECYKQLWHSRIINKDNDHNVTCSLFKLSHGKEMYTEILPEH